MEKLKKNLFLLILLYWGVFASFYEVHAQIKADPQDSLVLVAFNIEVQKYGWPQLWNTDDPVSTWKGISMNHAGKVTGLSLQDPKGFNTYSLPDAIEVLKGLSQLSSLSISMSHLQHISSKIGELNTLSLLQLDFNNIAHLPESIANLDKLTWLSLSYNELTGLPESMGSMTNLNRLNISFNQLSELPASFAQLTGLTHLNFSGNLLEAFPESIVDLESLLEIRGEQNKMKGGIPEALWERGERDLSPVPLGLYVSDNELSGRVLGENTDEYLVGILDISANKYTFQDIYPDYENLQLYGRKLIFMPQKKFGPLLQTIVPEDDSPHIKVEVEGFVPLEGSKVQWYFYRPGIIPMPSSSGYPLIIEKSPYYQGFYYCKITHPDFADYEITSNTIRVIIENKAPVLDTRNIKFRHGETPIFSLSASDDFSYNEQLQWKIPDETEHLTFFLGKIVAKDPNWIGTDTLKVSVADEHGNTTTANVLITILPLENTPPLMQVPDIYLTPDPQSPYCDIEGFTDCLYVWESTFILNQFISDDFDAVDDLHFKVKEADETSWISNRFYAGIGEYSNLDPELSANLKVMVYASQDTVVSLTLMVTDSEGGTTEQLITLIGKADNQQPQFLPIPEQFMIKGSAFPPLDLKQYVTEDYTPVADLSWLVYPGDEATVLLENGVSYLTPHDPKTARSFDVIYEVYESYLKATQISVTYTILEDGLIISGTIRSDDQQPVVGVRLNGLPGTVITDAHGRYQAEVPSGWSGILVPTMQDYAFSPDAIEISNLQASLNAQDFTATFIGSNHYVVSGKITDSQGILVAQASISGFPQPVFTASDGTYWVEVPVGWSGIISPVKEGFGFTPENIELNNLQADFKEGYFTAYAVITGMNPQKEARSIKLYPNPTQEGVQIELSLSLKQQGRAVVTNALGKTLWQTSVPPGSKHLYWPGTDQARAAVGTGIYQLQVWEADKLLFSGKVLIIK